MNPRYRFIYLFFGFAGYAFLIYTVISALPLVSLGNVLLIAIADFVFFLPAYKTYPAEDYLKRDNLNLRYQVPRHTP